MTNGNIEQHDQLDSLLLADIRERQQKLRQELEELEEAERAIAITTAYRNKALERLSSHGDAHPLTPQDIVGKSQRQILHLIAQRNGGWLAVQSAKRLMLDAKVLLNEDTASGQIYTLLKQKPRSADDHFVQVKPGLYRLVAVKKEAIAKSERQRKRGGQPGLVEKIALILREHPEWNTKQLLAEVQREGWDFGDKIPIFSVGIAYANLARRKKRNVQSQQSLLSIPRVS